MQLVGQCDGKSQMFLGWLRDWRLQYWLDNGRILKVALFPGPPSIEKTTCAAIACKRLRIEMLELNASRSKKCLFYDFCSDFLRLGLGEPSENPLKRSFFVRVYSPP
ncbi:hypothetical protein L596_001334 [Steinernema carpocapsae]|uniref:Uncharacterized protein n=1 Tax=Steinernema carpocapsae TaxID=34508 RepID=A0A4U8UL59_STECR|nr:hypothetical protein L596_001334 [Steinernema carpocapsae]